MEGIVKAHVSILTAVLLAFFVSGLAQATPISIVNGDFETGDLTGWTTFTTTNGTLGTGYPNVILFDTNNDGTATYSAQFNVGATQSPSSQEGGGIYQDVFLNGGNITISADIAVRYLGAIGNAQGGIFNLILDGTTLDTHSFGSILGGQSFFSTLWAVANVSAGTHEIRFSFTREYTSLDSPEQFIDNIVLSSPSAIPEPASLLLLGTGLSALGLAAYRRRRK